ncbi:MAG: hypothetical protein JWN76_2092 [Chitinophagaceae bacterium]|nr:hypothetical protein [Chitinophagaceae bacterium]
MIPRIIGYTAFVLALLTGLLSLYRASLKTSDLTVIKGKVKSKNIFFYNSRGARYRLSFDIEGRKEPLALNLGGRRDSQKDSTIYKVDTGKIYTFFLDPTVPHGKKSCPVSRIEYNGKLVYQSSNKLNIWGGSIITLMSLAAIILVYRNPPKNKGSTSAGSAQRNPRY